MNSLTFLLRECEKRFKTLRFRHANALDNQTLKKILPVFSYLFHPLFIPLFAVVLFFYTDENYLSAAQKLVVLLQVLIMTVLIPIAFFFLLRTLGKIDTAMAKNVSQRKLPLILQVVLLVMLLRQSLPPDHIPELFFFFLGAIVTSIAALVAAYAAMKPSLHMAAVGAMLVFVIGLSFHNQQNMIAIISGLLIATGLTASSRLQMEAHSYPELVFGFLIGIVPQLALWHLWL